MAEREDIERFLVELRESSDSLKLRSDRGIKICRR